MQSGAETQCLTLSNSAQINDRYEFPEELDLDIGDRKYLSKEADATKRNRFKLHSVLVHSGGTHGGHYYMFSRPDGTQWLRFDDEKVQCLASGGVPRVCSAPSVRSLWSGLHTAAARFYMCCLT